MQNYLNLLEDIMSNGNDKADRTGTGTRSVFGKQLRFNLSNGFPLLTTKRMHWKSIVHELLWFISGSTNIKYLQDNGVTIWNEWADENGELGPVYGSQWRNWQGCTSDGQLNTVDQLMWVQNEIRNNPNSRRLLVNAWNVSQVPEMKLPPCHFAFQFNVDGEYLSCHMTQRSADSLLGIPFNIASYALLTHMMAMTTGYQPGELIISFGDTHIYKNHFNQVATQIERRPFSLPTVRLDNVDCITKFKYENIHLENYICHPAISAPISK